MKRTNKCLKEWNAVVEALGEGKQTILIRSYKTNLNGFLLYPTVGYASNNNYLNSFKKNYRSFVEKNTFPIKEDNKIEIRYFTMVEKIIEIPIQKVEDVNEYHIWTNEHVISYLKSNLRAYMKNRAYIWILRAYKLKAPYMATYAPGMRFGNLKNNVSIIGSKAVLDDKQFSKITEKLDKI